MKTTKKWLCCLLCVTMLLMLPSCKKKSVTPQDEIIYYSIPFEPDSLDPQIANDSSSRLIVMNIYEGLTRLNQSEVPVPGAAECWVISDDETTYTFILRDDACWNNGDKVTAEDFLFGLQRTLDPGTGSEGAPSLYSIKNAEAVHQGKMPMDALGITASDGKLVIRLEHPDTGFLTTLSTAPAMPCQKKFFDSTQGQYGRDDDKVLSNGPFYVRKSGWSHDEYIHLRKNQSYHGSNEPIPAGINISIAPAPENVCSAISDGTVDCYTLPGSELADARKKGLYLTSFGETVWGIAFNTENEVLQIPEIRRALLAALDRSYVLKEVPDGCSAVTDIIPESVMLDGYSYRSHAPEGLCVPYSESAKEELKKALKKNKIDQLPKLTILCTDDAPTQKIVNNIIETWNAQTGTYNNKNPVSASELNDAVLTGSYRIVVAPLVACGSSPIDTLALFTSSSAYNPARLADKQYDQAVASLDQLKGQALLKKLIETEEYLNDQGIFYPLYTENRYYASAPNVKGIIFHPYGSGIDFFFAEKTES